MAETISREEAIQYLIDAGLSESLLVDGAEMTVLIDTFIANIEDAGAFLEEECYKMAKDLLTENADELALAAAESMARDAARIQAETLATNLTQAELDKIAEVVKQGLAQGLHPDKIAQQLDMVQGLDSNRAKQQLAFIEDLKNQGLSETEIQKKADANFESLLKDRKQSIARTETRYATENAQYLNASARGARFKVQITAQDGRVSQLCRQNEAAGPIEIDKPFPSGHLRTPIHPECRCSTSYLTSDVQFEEAQKRAEERAKKTSEAQGN